MKGRLKVTMAVGGPVVLLIVVAGYLWQAGVPGLWLTLPLLFATY